MRDAPTAMPAICAVVKVGAEEGDADGRVVVVCGGVVIVVPIVRVSIVDGEDDVSVDGMSIEDSELNRRVVGPIDVGNGLVEVLLGPPGAGEEAVGNPGVADILAVPDGRGKTTVSITVTVVSALGAMNVVEKTAVVTVTVTILRGKTVVVTMTVVVTVTSARFTAMASMRRSSFGTA